MPRTLGYHVVMSGYGLWLPGDQRGSWSEAWDQQLGYIEPHTLHKDDPVRRRMAEERLQHPPVRLSPAMSDAVVRALNCCAAESDWSVAAASVESTHTHLLITFTPRNIDNTIKWIKDQTTKAVHRWTQHRGPVWCKGKWCSFMFDDQAWQNNRQYIEQHNIRRGLSPRPYPFLSQR